MQTSTEKNAQICLEFLDTMKLISEDTENIFLVCICAVGICFMKSF